MKKVLFLMEEKDRSRDEYSSAIIWWYGILENMGYEVMYYDYFNFNFESFYKETKEWRPDFIFHPTYDRVHTEFIKLREFSKTYVIHSDDDYRFDDFAKIWIPFVTGTISFCGGEREMRQMYANAGATENSFIKAYWCFNPNTMAHQYKPNREDVLCHIGSVYGERLRKCNDFKSYGIDIQVHQNKLYEDFKKLVSKSYYSLCLTRASNNFCNQVKGRIFELPFSSALLSEPFPDMEQYYDLDKEILVYNSIQEGSEKIRKSLIDNTWSKIYEAGKKRLLSEHTAYHIWNSKILPLIDQDYKPIDPAKILKEVHGL